MREDFEKFKGTRLSNLFDLKYNKIRGFSIAILVVNCSALFLGIILECFDDCCEKCKCKKSIYNILKKIVDVIFFIGLILLINIAILKRI